MRRALSDGIVLGLLHRGGEWKSAVSPNQLRRRNCLTNNSTAASDFNVLLLTATPIDCPVENNSTADYITRVGLSSGGGELMVPAAIPIGKNDCGGKHPNCNDYGRGKDPGSSPALDRIGWPALLYGAPRTNSLSSQVMKLELRSGLPDFLYSKDGSHL